MKDVLMINTSRDGYGIDQISKTLTVGEMLDILSQYEEDTEVYLSFDSGYTYGGITESRIILGFDNGGGQIEEY